MASPGCSPSVNCSLLPCTDQHNPQRIGGVLQHRDQTWDQKLQLSQGEAIFNDVQYFDFEARRVVMGFTRRMAIFVVWVYLFGLWMLTVNLVGLCPTLHEVEKTIPSGSFEDQSWERNRNWIGNSFDLDTICLRLFVAQDTSGSTYSTEICGRFHSRSHPN